MKLRRIPHILTEEGWANPPAVPPNEEQLEKLKSQLFERIRERVFEKLQGIPEDERGGEDLATHALYSTGLLILLARSSDLNEATARLHGAKAKGPDTASTIYDAKERLVVTADNFPTELSILKDFYGRIAAGDDIMDLCARIQVRLGVED
jgi:hypothetical protein